MTKTIFMIAGPNGAGKTTIAMKFMYDKLVGEFINADEIARGLAPLHPSSVSIAASKLLLKRFLELVKSEQSFAFETTGAGTNYIKHLNKAKKAGYKVHLIFLWLNNSNLAIERVANRVKQGGHDIPKDTIVRRYYAGSKNLVNHYLPIADKAFIFDNSVAESNRLVIKKYSEGSLKIIDPIVWSNIQEVANAKQK